MAKQYILTPFAPVIMAYTEKPDAPYEGEGDPKYKIKLDPSPEDLAAFRAELAKIAAGYTFKVKNPKLGVSIAQADGKVTIVPTSKFKPAIYDCANNKLEAPKIGAGSIARAYCQLNIHDKGIGLQLVQVQVKKLVEWEGSGAAGSSAFGTEDGFVAPVASGFAAEPAAVASGTSALDI